MIRCRLGLSLLVVNWLGAQGLEPDFERLWPLTSYERVQQGLVQFWQQAEQPLVQCQILQTVLQELAQWEGAAGGRWAPPQGRLPQAADVAYLVRLLDYIQLQLKLVETRGSDPVRQLLQVVRLKLVHYS